MEDASPLLVRSYFSTFVCELDIAAYQTEWLNNLILPLFTMEYQVMPLENMSLQSASTKGRIVQRVE